jgi:hypothetical protein
MEPMFKHARKALGLAALLAAAALGGSALANATSSQGITGPTGSSSSSPPAFHGPAHGTAAHEDAEKAVTGAAASKAQAAAVKAIGGGTAGAVTTDCTGNGYETTVTKSDGTKVEVHLDSSFRALQGPGGHGGPPPGSPGA